ncbi:MAG: glycosyltransferase family 4 protein [Ignavibacteriaceae bacterium]|nr:glycosyltransferase family 4 protein [Ignavibacteriaceae bacterium]
MKINILHITPDFNLNCGRSKYVFRLLKYFEKHQNFDLHFITNGGDALYKLNELTNCKIKYLDFGRGIKNIFNIYRNVKEFKDYCISNNINIIHTHHRYPEYVASLIKKKLKIKTVSSALSSVEGFKRLSFKSDLIVACSESLKKNLVDVFGIEENKVKVLHHCIEPFPEISDDDRNSFIKKINLKTGEKIILFVGRITHIKGYDVIFEACRKLRISGVPFRLVMMGSLIDRKSRDIFREDFVTYIKPNEKYYCMYDLADVIVIPSRVDPYPLVMLEAALFAKPIISSDIPGITEFVKENETGFLVPAGNAELLARKIKFVLDNDELSTFIGYRAREQALNHHSCNKFFNQIEKFYIELVS